MNCSTILTTESTGTAKPNPSAATNFMTLTPTTSPSRFTRGPPEFPYRKPHKEIIHYFTNHDKKVGPGWTIKYVSANPSSLQVAKTAVQIIKEWAMILLIKLDNDELRTSYLVY